MAQFFNSNNRCNQMPCSGYAQQPAYYQEPTYCPPQNCMPQNCIPAEMAMPKTLDQKLHLAPGQPTATKDFILKCSNLNEDGSLTFDLKIDSKLQNLFFNSVNDRGASWTASPTNMNFNDYQGTSSENKSWEINTFINPKDNSWRNVVVTLKEGTDAIRISAGNQTFVINREEIIEAIVSRKSTNDLPADPIAEDLPPMEDPQIKPEADDLPPMHIPQAEPEAEDLPPMDVAETETEAEDLPPMEPEADDLPMFQEDAVTKHGSEADDLPPLTPELGDPFRTPDATSNSPYLFPEGIKLEADSPAEIPSPTPVVVDEVAQDLPPVNETTQTNYQAQAKDLYDKIHISAKGNPTNNIIAYIASLPTEEKSGIMKAYNDLNIQGRGVRTFAADLIRTRTDITPDQIEQLVVAMMPVHPQANKLAKDLYVEMNGGLTTYNQAVLKLIADNSKYAGEAAKLYQDFYGHKVNIIYEAAKNNNQIQRDLKAVLSDVEYGAVASYFNMDKFPSTNLGFSPASYAQQLYDCFPKYWKNNQELFVSMVGALKADESKYNLVNEEFKKLDGKFLEEFAKGYTFTSEQNAILNAPAVKVAQ